MPEYRLMRFRKAIEDVNVTIATYNDEFMGDQLVAPEMGIVAFDLECMVEASTWSASRRRRPGQCHAVAGCGKLMIVKLCVGMHVLPTQKLGVGMHVLPTPPGWNAPFSGGRFLCSSTGGER